MINDISRAFFHAKVKRDVYVQLAEEDRKPGEEAMCSKLNYSMYGTRDAAQNWFEEYSNQLRSIGSTQGTATPCVFHHPPPKGIFEQWYTETITSVPECQNNCNG